MVDNLSNDIYEAKVEEFKSFYGIDPGVAEVLFKDATLKNMLEHMYLDAMTCLRECDHNADGRHIQGQAQTLWTLLCIPKEIETLRNMTN